MHIIRTGLKKFHLCFPRIFRDCGVFRCKVAKTKSNIKKEEVQSQEQIQKLTNMSYQPTISESLQKTVSRQEDIKMVYFDENGNHYFNVHLLPLSLKDLDDEDSWKLYGSGRKIGSRPIPGRLNVQPTINEAIHGGNKHTEIVAQMTREEVLSATVKREGQSAAVQIANSTDAEKALIAEQIGLDKNAYAFVKGLTAEKIEKLNALLSAD